jgi:CHAD domain-containing protein
MDADPAGLRLRRYVDNELQIAASALTLRGHASRDGVHRARKAIRRTRAALLLGWPAPDAAVALAVDRLKYVNDQLSGLRDAHALVGALDRLLEGETGTTREMLDHARKGLARNRSALEHDPAAGSLLQDAGGQVRFIAAGIDALAWDDVAEDDIATTLDATARKVDRARRDALADGKAKDWHKWRRRLRRLSQQRRACAALGIEAPFTPFDKSVAEQLGKLQDHNALLAKGPRLAGLRGKRKQRFRRAVRDVRNQQRQRVVSVVALND